MKTNVYVDAFNLYYGSLTETPYKWLDIDRLCRQVYPSDTINRIRIFAAHVRQTPNDPSKHIRQQVYFRALKTIPHLSIHLGQFSMHDIWAPLVNPFPTTPPSALAIPFWYEGTPAPGKTDAVIGVKTNGMQMARVRKTEEKGSDVNLITHLLIDAFEKDCEKVIVISNDSDFKSPIEYVNTTLGIPVCILHPCRSHSVQKRQVKPGAELKTVAHASDEINISLLASSQFPISMSDQHGTITKPSSW